MDLDDLPIGRVLTRREALTLLGSTGTLLLLGCSPSNASSSRAGKAGYPCIVRPAMTEGPYYVDEKLERSDIRSDPSDGTVKDGALLALTFNVSSIAKGACTPLKGAIVDIWHCDALGVYSDAVDPSFNTTGKKFLRGHQVTDAKGMATFTTIYPGWYPGRAVHIHFKLRTDPDSNAGQEFTSQWFFDESLTDVVHTAQPYASRGYRTLKNEGDNIYRGAGDQMILQASPEGDGYLAVFDIGMQLS
jgi:protocatechuate 3,4-dioxygenase beta subunit